jgi:hypothetical protein
LFGQFPFLAKLFADSAYAGSIFHTALAGVLPNLRRIEGRHMDGKRLFRDTSDKARPRWILEQIAV